MSRHAVAHAKESTIARTIRIPAALRKKIAADAERCGRSFEGQVIALLRRHYGEDVDIAPGPAGILALAVASLAEIPAVERDLRQPPEVSQVGQCSFADIRIPSAQLR